MAALCLTGCASSRKSTEAKERSVSMEADSMVTELRRLTLEPVPQSQVQLTLQTDSVAVLPDGAQFRAKSGRASVSVTKGTKPGTIVVYASCDSLQRLVETYERKANAYKQQLDEQKQEAREAEKPPNRWWKEVAALSACLLAGIVITYKINRRI